MEAFATSLVLYLALTSLVSVLAGLVGRVAFKPPLAAPPKGRRRRSLIRVGFQGAPN
jgi:polar amino acid transport system permease protein